MSIAGWGPWKFSSILHPSVSSLSSPPSTTSTLRNTLRTTYGMQIFCFLGPWSSLFSCITPFCSSAPELYQEQWHHGCVPHLSVQFQLLYCFVPPTGIFTETELCFSAHSLHRCNSQCAGWRNLALFSFPFLAVTALGFWTARSRTNTLQQRRKTHRCSLKQWNQPAADLPSSRVTGTPSRRIKAGTTETPKRGKNRIICSETDPAVGTRSLSPPLWVNPTLFFYALGYFGQAVRTAALTDEDTVPEHNSTCCSEELNRRNRDHCSAACLFLMVIIYLLTCKLFFSAGFKLYHYKWFFKSFVRAVPKGNLPAVQLKLPLAT